MLGTALGILAGSLEIALSAVRFWQMKRVCIPADRRPVIAAHTLALALGVAALALGGGGLALVLAGIAVLGAAIFLALQTQSAQARSTPAAALGGPILDFTLPDHEGKPFHLATLRGKPFLLKFFRGHW